MAGHQADGEHMYDGVAFMKYNSPGLLDRVKQMTLRPQDVILVTYPKAGTAWGSEIIYQLMNEGAAPTENVRDRVPFVELTTPGKPVQNIDRLLAQPNGRTFATHLFPHFFEKEMLLHRPKIVVMMRNPKDCLVSYYHFYRASGPLGKFTGSFDDFWEQLVVPERLVYGDAVKHFAAWWKFRKEENFLFLKYEDMKLRPAEEFHKIARHLGVAASKERIQEIAQKTAFDKMSKDPLINKEGLPKQIMDSSISKYLRKGQVGDWKSQMSREQSTYIDKLVHDQLEPVGLNFDYE